MAALEALKFHARPTHVSRPLVLWRVLDPRSGPRWNHQVHMHHRHPAACPKRDSMPVGDRRRQRTQTVACSASEDGTQRVTTVARRCRHCR